MNFQREKEKLSLIEIRDRIDEKTNEYKRISKSTFKNKIDYYDILEDIVIKLGKLNKLSCYLGKRICFIDYWAIYLCWVNCTN